MWMRRKEKSNGANAQRLVPISSSERTTIVCTFTERNTKSDLCLQSADISCKQFQRFQAAATVIPQLQAAGWELPLAIQARNCPAKHSLPEDVAALQVAQSPRAWRPSVPAAPSAHLPGTPGRQAQAPPKSHIRELCLWTFKLLQKAS